MVPKFGISANWEFQGVGLKFDQIIPAMVINTPMVSAPRSAHPISQLNIERQSELIFNAPQFIGRKY